MRNDGVGKAPQRNRGRTPVLLAVGEPLAAAALKRVVESDASFEVVAVASDAQRAIRLGGQGRVKIAVLADLAPTPAVPPLCVYAKALEAFPRWNVSSCHPVAPDECVRGQ
jgi:DNA-binding NarL/FixJ family response regulator